MTKSEPVRSAFHEPVEPPPPGSPWTLLQLLRWSTGYLAGKGVPEPRLDAEHLLAHVLGMGRLDLYLHFERPLTPDELEGFRPLLLERAGRKPLQYILGTVSFRGLELRVDPRALIPRPETEELVEAVLAHLRESGAHGRGQVRSSGGRGQGRASSGRGPMALDVGTGSGAIALALAAEGSFARVVATDRSADALALAGENAELLGLEDRVELREGNLLDPVARGEQFDVLVSNPPYVAEEEYGTLEPEVTRWEPRSALVAPDGGMRWLRRLIGGAPEVLSDGGLLAIEIGAEQAGEVEAAIGAVPAFDAPRVVRDLSGRDRIVLAERRERPEAPTGEPGGDDFRTTNEG